MGLKGFKTPQYVQGAASQSVIQGTKPLGHRYRECTHRSMPVLECFYVVFIRHRGKVHYGSIEGFIHHTVRVRGVIVCKRNNTYIGSNNTRPVGSNNTRPRNCNDDQPFIVLTETKTSNRYIPVWARYSPLRNRVEAHAITLSP